ncbi:hypothetical protein [Nostoc sp. ChiQUE01b]|uniref:hypothetical protein n=1 Tax=Nostoc sp. ChiQUE01b TaxID=3075376 RepID=UPI002AD47180|nr:hypothetical protein [Nostoc sp. ChiQUE01b]MDZ8259288.1 hypothetical protein [Nostoc sp. ChiQUE01b]
MVVEGFSDRPVAVFFDTDAKRNQTNWWQPITQQLPVGGLLITDMGFYGFEWFDALTRQNPLPWVIKQYGSDKLFFLPLLPLHPLLPLPASREKFP